MKTLIDQLLIITEELSTIDGVLVVSIAPAQRLVKVVIAGDRRLLHERISGILRDSGLTDQGGSFDPRSNTYTFSFKPLVK